MCGGGGGDKLLVSCPEGLLREEDRDSEARVRSEGGDSEGGQVHHHSSINCSHHFS